MKVGGSRQASCLCKHVGEEGQQYTLQFDEKSGPDPLGDMLIKVRDGVTEQQLSVFV